MRQCLSYEKNLTELCDSTVAGLYTIFLPRSPERSGQTSGFFCGAVETCLWLELWYAIKLLRGSVIGYTGDAVETLHHNSINPVGLISCGVFAF